MGEVLSPSGSDGVVVKSNLQCSILVTDLSARTTEIGHLFSKVIDTCKRHCSIVFQSFLFSVNHALLSFL